jgi:hypothetical protein
VIWVGKDFSRFPAKEVRLALDPPTPGSQRPERVATKQPDGTWMVSGMALAEPGIWTRAGYRYSQSEETDHARRPDRYRALM